MMGQVTWNISWQFCKFMIEQVAWNISWQHAPKKRTQQQLQSSIETGQTGTKSEKWLENGFASGGDDLIFPT